MKKLCAAVCLTLIFVGCAGAPAATEQPAPCVMNNEMTAKVTMEYEGNTIGFCCDNCMKKFNELSAEEKAAKVAASMKK